jgi:diguanylate cyclase (GGDEF)-like protein
MPKGKPDERVRAKRAVKRTRDGARKPRRRQSPSAETAKAVGRRGLSDAALLAAEVERLERELAAARRQLAALEACADIDPLTGLPNRRAFERELGRSLAYVKRHGTSVALLYIDLDEFKGINDRHGHAAGDAVLRAVAGVLGRHVRGSDLVARIGGDEFALLLWNCDEPSAVGKALTLEAAIERTMATHDGAVLGVGASVGAARLLPLDLPFQTIAQADRSMYARKAVRRMAARCMAPAAE